MFNAVLISPDPLRQAVIQRLAVESGHVALRVQKGRTRNGCEAAQSLVGANIDLVFLDLSEVGEAILCAEEIREAAPGVALIGFGDSVRQTRLGGDGRFTAMIAGVPDLDSFQSVVRYAIRATRGRTRPGLFAFMPSKAGSGATTVLLHTAWALAAEAQRGVMVLEADLRSGALPVYLNTEPRWSMLDALAAPPQELGRLMENATESHGVEFLLGRGETDGQLPQWHQYYKLLKHVCERWEFVLADLPELVNPATAEIVCQAERVLVVCTPEIASLRLAGRRCAELTSWGVANERVGIILNRWQGREMARRDVETFLDREIFTFVPNDYPAIRKAMLNASPLPEGGSLAKAFAALAAKIAGRPEAEQSKPAGLLSKLREALA
jgi:Flp pilus assembly CpaE family ATPase